MDALEITRAQLRALEEGRPFATVSIVDAEGSTARTQGKMLVFADGSSLGTVGGSAKERAAIRDAAACIRTGESCLRRYGDEAPAQDGRPLSGTITVFIEVSPPRPRLLVVGGGHVGRSVLYLARFLGYETWLADDRDRKSIGEAVDLAGRFIPVTDYAADLRALELPPDTFAVLCTYSHDTDGAALSVLAERELAYLGMLGSRRKIEKLFARARERGVAEERLRRVRTPIGLALGGETPQEVALCVLAEIQAVRFRTPLGTER